MFWRRGVTLALCLGTLLTGCGATRAADPTLAHWTAYRHVLRVVDLSRPRSGGSIVVATDGRLALLDPRTRLRPFSPGYSEHRGLEPYIALSRGEQVKSAHCSFGIDNLYVLRLTHGRGITEVDAQGRVRRFARLPNAGLLDGIAFDETGRFAHRLLVTSTATGVTTVYAIDCRGHVEILTTDAPRVEGGLSVAPATFGAFAGDLIAPEEQSGNLYAIAPDGHASLIAASNLPHGQDIGIESSGFVPTRYADALVADRLTPGNRHPGNDLILALSHATLSGDGVRAGDLLVVTEGSANTIAVSCAQRCQVRDLATGPAVAHIEGHVVFTQR
jgi:hypothetical protein